VIPPDGEHHGPPPLPDVIPMPGEEVSPYAKYLRLLPFLVVLVPDRYILDLGRVFDG